MWSRRTVWSKKTWGWKKMKKLSHLFWSLNIKLTVFDCSSLICTLKHSLPKLGDRTHRFSFLTVEAESLLKKLKPITLVVTTGDMNSLVLYSLQLFTFWCLLSVFSTLNYPNCFKLSPSVLLSRSLIIPCWSPLASFETGPHFFWNAV